MKPNVIAESGIIDANGQFRLPMDRVNAFFKDNKGKRVMVRFETAEPGSSAAMLAYYYNYVLPTITAAFYETGQRMTDEYSDRYLIQEYPGNKNCDYIGGSALYGRDLNQRQMFDFLEWLKQYAAENLSVYIEDPRTI